MATGRREERQRVKTKSEVPPHEARGSVRYQQQHKRVRTQHSAEAAARNLWKRGVVTNRPGERNPTVAALRALQPAGRTRKGGQRTYPPKGASRFARRTGGQIIMDETRLLGDRVPLSELGGTP